MKTILINRIHDDGNRTISKAMIYENRASLVQTIRSFFKPAKQPFKFYTIERPWKNNERRVSCIPTGEYVGLIHHSPRFGKTIWIQDVPDRSEILIHPANFASELMGCIAPGQVHNFSKETNFVKSSRRTLDSILDYIGDDKKVRILIDDVFSNVNSSL